MTVEAAILVYQEKYKNKDDKKDKSDKTDQQKEKDKYKTPANDKSAKEASKGIPSWAKGKRPYVWENGKEFAERLMNEQYGKGNWEDESKGKPGGPKDEYKVKDQVQNIIS